MSSATERLSTAVADRYRIERHLGEGGMATVYLAHDLKHDRKVALKVLRPELAAVIGAERFLAEIRTTANLQHPNILPLFDSGDAEGQLFYVMPYVEGETLRDRIDHEKQLPVDDVVRLGAEVASALDYAHRQGVIHRDIKPENILVHDGRALVADFGIALAVSTAGPRMTETGMSVGTPHYMSPEQAMGGHEVTAKSDVYALGATLYEALVGEPPFTGATAQAIIARIVTEDPRPLRTQRKTIPAHVEGAVLRALERLPADRFATAAAFGEALEGRVKVRMRAGAATGVTAGDANRTLRIPSARATAAGITILTLGAAALLGWLRPAPTLPKRRQPIVMSTLMLRPHSIAWGAAVAPDGSAFVYTRQDPEHPNSPWLLLKERGQLRPRRLATITSYPGPSFSPDGQSIAFTDGKLERVSRQGGTPTALSDSVMFGGTAWLDNGMVASIGAHLTHLYVTPSRGGPTKRIVGADSAGTFFTQVSPVPGENAVLVSVGAPCCRVVAVDLATGVVHGVMRGALRAWVVGEELLYAQSDGVLYARSFDKRSFTVSGPPVTVADSLQVRSGIADVVVGRGGTLLYVRGTPRVSRSPRLARVARDGTAVVLDTAVSLPVADLPGLDLSPDGTRVALSLVDSAEGRSDIYVVDLSPRGVRTRLTFSGTSNAGPRWSPDGMRIMYASNAGRGGRMRLWAKRADGTEPATLVASDSRSAATGLWSPDGKWIVYATDLGTAGNGDIIGVRVGSDTTHVPLVATPAPEFAPALSPDGRWLAYSKEVNGRDEVFVRPFPYTKSGSMWQVTAHGLLPEWSHDGSELFYLSLGVDNEMMAVSVTTSPTFAVGAPEPLFDVGAYRTCCFGHLYAVTPDDRHFMMLTYPAGRTTPDARVVEVENWLPEIQAKLKGR